MAYQFAGFFACPAVPRPEALPGGADWREITKPFLGVGVRLPALIDDESLPEPADVRVLARRLGIDAADRWLYLTYDCWGGDIDFVYGLGANDGEPFGPVEDSSHETVEATYVGLMGKFGVPSEAALRFEPFERGFWADA